MGYGVGPAAKPVKVIYDAITDGVYSGISHTMTTAAPVAGKALNGPAADKLSDRPGGARVPGTAFELDPATAAFNIGCLVRWLDMNDTFTGAAAIHPSDSLAGILAVADYLSRQPGARRLTPRSSPVRHRP